MNGAIRAGRRALHSLALCGIAVCMLGAAPGGAPVSSNFFGSVVALASSPHAGGATDDGDVRSFRGVFRTPDHETSYVVRDAEHDRWRFTSLGYAHSVTIMDGMTSYFQARDGTWSKLDGARFLKTAPHRTPLPPDAPPHHQSLPDRRVHGVLMGVYRETFVRHRRGAHGPIAETIAATCIFEKATGHLRSCDVPGQFSATFDHYNDPSNRITIPPEALHAPDEFRDLK